MDLPLLTNRPPSSLELTLEGPAPLHHSGPSSRPLPHSAPRSPRPVLPSGAAGSARCPGGVWVGLAILGSLSVSGRALAAFGDPLLSTRGAVAADHELASRAGAEVLARGGNAIDAAVATALALGVVQPAGSGLGGGGFLVVRLADGTVKALDFREVAPRGASRDMFVDQKTGKPDPERSRHGGLAVAVPGEPAGLGEALRTLGKLPPAQVVAPALKLARDGFPVGAHLHEMAVYADKRLAKDNPLRAFLIPGGKPLQRGQLVKRPELARTLEALGKRGFWSFYREGGEGSKPSAIAGHIARAAQDAGGVLKAEDLAEYKPLWREVVRGAYRGYQVFSIPPPGGGLTALEALQILDARPPLKEGPLASQTLHTIAESLKHAFADRARILGDPGFVSVPTEELRSAAYARELAGRFRDDVLPAASYGKGPLPKEAPRDKGTSHLCAIDKDGNAAALTTTVNLDFGAHIVAGPTGVILNNQMDDFSAQAGSANAFGLVGDKANEVAAGKRPLSSMSPLIAVGQDGTILCAGGSGGPTIVTGTVQAVVNVIDFHMDARAAVSAPRIHAQFIPDRVIIEPGIPLDVQEALKKRGHTLVVRPEPMGTAIQLVVQRRAATEDEGVRGPKAPKDAKAPGPKDAKAQEPAAPVTAGVVVTTAASDPRKGGEPAAP